LIISVLKLQHLVFVVRASLESPSLANLILAPRPPQPLDPAIRLLINQKSNPCGQEAGRGLLVNARQTARVRAPPAPQPCTLGPSHPKLSMQPCSASPNVGSCLLSCQFQVWALFKPGLPLLTKSVQIYCMYVHSRLVKVGNCLNHSRWTCGK